MILTVERRWECPNCTVTDTTRQAGVHTRYHRCRGLAGLNVPMVPAGTKAKVVAQEREDYVGREQVQTDANGRPIMAVITVRDDGQDTTVYAPTANARKD